MHQQSTAEPGAVLSAMEIRPPPAVVGDAVAILISDIEGSTELAERLDAGWQHVLSRHHRLIRRACLEHAGFEAGNNGDGFLYLFSQPDAALRAAVISRSALARARWPDGTRVLVRIAIHVGAVLHRSDAGFIGIDLHRTARIMATAHGGQILLSKRAFDDLSASSPAAGDGFVDHGLFWLKDLRSPERIYELTSQTDPRGLRAQRVGQADCPPVPCRLVGRDPELKQLVAAVHERSGVPITIHGMGGVGKTRLAVELLRTIPSRRRLFVDLAHLADESHFLAELDRQIGIDATGSPALSDVASEINQRRAVVVLDNLEQIIGVAPMVASLARLAPNARVVTTSRVKLRVSGEVVITVHPLPADDGSEAPAAFRLLDELARQLDIEPALTGPEREAAKAICRLLDGVPLAIELAVGRVEMLGYEGLRDHLEESTAMLVGGRRDATQRHDGLDKAIQWSFDLLSDDGRRLFLCLSQLPGGGSAEAVAQLSRVAPDQAVVALQELVDHRLVGVTTGVSGHRRFRMLRLLREFGSTRLAATAWGDALRARIRARSCQLARRSAVETQSTLQHQVYQEVLEELDNVRGMLESGLQSSDGRADALAVVTDLTSFWWQSHLDEGLVWMSRLAAIAEPETPFLARALVRAALLACYGGQADDALRLASDGVEVCRRQGRSDGDLSLGLQVLAAAWSAQGKRELALSAVAEGLEIDRTVAPDARAIHIVNHGNVLLAENLVDEAEELYLESRAHFDARGDTWLVAGPLARLGDVAIRRGHLREAAKLLGDAISAWRHGGGTSGQARAQAGLARAQLLAGHHDEAVQLAQAAFVWAREAGSLGEVPWAVAVAAASLVEEGRVEDAALFFGAARRLGIAYGQPMQGCLDHDLAAADLELERLLQPGAASELRREGGSWAVDEIMDEVVARWI
jgi:predicted ATPase